MKGDFSQSAFAALKHYTAVLMQQGRVLLDADADEAQAILDYLARQPNAEDTLEGIVRWWLPQRKGVETVRRVQGLLDQLVSLELVICMRRPDGRTCYRFNRRKASAVSKRARPARKKKTP